MAGKQTPILDGLAVGFAIVVVGGAATGILWLCHKLLEALK